MSAEDVARLEEADLDALLEAVYQRYAYDFRQYARASMRRRVASALAVFGVPSVADLQATVLADAQAFARLLSTACDGLATVDPHLHRRSCLGEIYAVPTRIAHAASAVAAWIAAKVDAPLLIGPDEESGQWVSAVAEAAGAPFTVLEKVRRGDREVEVSVPEVERHRGRTPVLVDDIVSTGRTMVETARHLERLGLGRPVCVGVHAVFAEGAWEALREVAARVVTCNTVLHPSNAIDVSGLVAGALGEQLALGGEVRTP